MTSGSSRCFAVTGGYIPKAGIPCFTRQRFKQRGGVRRDPESQVTDLQPEIGDVDEWKVRVHRWRKYLNALETYRARLLGAEYRAALLHDKEFYGDHENENEELFTPGVYIEAARKAATRRSFASRLPGWMRWRRYSSPNACREVPCLPTSSARTFSGTRFKGGYSHQNQGGSRNEG
jgi:hypothetical protein